MKSNNKIKLAMMSMLVITLSGCTILNEEPKLFKDFEVVQKKITKEIQQTAICSLKGNSEPVVYKLENFVQGSNGSVMLTTKDGIEITTHMSNCIMTREIVDLE